MSLNGFLNVLEMFLKNFVNHICAEKVVQILRNVNFTLFGLPLPHQTALKTHYAPVLNFTLKREMGQ